MGDETEWATATRVEHSTDVGVRHVRVWCDFVEIAAAIAADGGKPWVWRVASPRRIAAQGMCATEDEAKAAALAAAKNGAGE
jgi:hypothetical protein